MLFGSLPHFAPLAERYFSIPDLLNIRNRLIGSGRIGGKAAGMLLARKILQTRGSRRSGEEFRRRWKTTILFTSGQMSFILFW